ncbi:MAG: HEAT repeat domain-containing protein [Nitrospirota bacterium]
MDPSFDIKLRFPPEDQMVAGHLGKFTISLVQALLKMGHFQSADAKTVVAKKELFAGWEHLVQKGQEVSFIVKKKEGHTELLVYGILSKITPLEHLFSADIAEIFTPKFVDFFNRRYLAGFSIKPGITFEEMEKFIDIIGKPINVADMDQAILSVTEALVQNQVVHASLVYEKELPKDRSSLHLMTQMALTRFSKELETIPLYSHLLDDQKQLLKKRTFLELLIPLSDAAILKEILIESGQVTPSGWDPPLNMVEEISKGVGIKLLWIFLSESANTMKTAASDSESDRLAQDCLVLIVKKIVMNLSLEQMEDHSVGVLPPEAILESLLETNTVTLMEIPELVLARVYLIRKTNDYLQSKERYWEEACWSRTEGNALIPILPVLLKQNQFQDFGELLDQLEKKWQEAGFALGPPDFLSQVGIESIRDAVLSKLQDRQIQNRKELFVVLENQALALSFHQRLLPFSADEDILLRRNVCRVIACAGEAVVPNILAYGKEPVRNWYAVRNVVMMLGDIGSFSEPTVTFLKRCYRHPNPRVREETMTSLGKIKGAEAEKILIHELENKDKTVQAATILALGNFDPAHPRTLEFLQETVRKKRKNEIEADEQLQINCCLAIESIARFNGSAAQLLCSMLCDAISPDKPGLFGIIREKHHEKGYAVKKAICQLLGEIGTKESFPLVGRLITEKYWRPEDNAAMLLAMQKIEHRMSTISSVGEHDRLP